MISYDPHMNRLNTATSRAINITYAVVIISVSRLFSSKARMRLLSIG